MSRYIGKPFLRVLELYVLHCIGALSDLDETTIREMEPRFSALYGTALPWYKTVEAVLHMPANASEQIADLWSRNRVRAEAEGVVLDPQRFAEQFSDRNFR